MISTKCAKELMSSPVISIHPRDTLEEAAKILVDNGISGAPVVAGQSIEGVVSLTDIATFVAGVEGRVDGISGFYTHSFPESDGEGDWDNGLRSADQDLLSNTTVSDIMSPALISVQAKASAQEVARELCARKIHRIMVLDGECLVGLITPLDLLADAYNC